MKTLKTAIVGLFFLGMPVLAQASESITTLFATNNTNAGNMFDVTVSGLSPVTLTHFDININQGCGTADISVYYKPGSYVGFEANAAAWTLLGTGVVTPLGLDLPTPLDVGATLTLSPGETYGLYFDLESFGMGCLLRYTNGGSVYMDDHLTLTLGVAKGNPAFSGETNNARTWNGTIYYRLGCPPGPLVCTEAAKAQLVVKADKKASWKWAGGYFDFGDPSASTAYSFCLYVNGTLEQEAALPPGDYKKIIPDKKAIYKGQADGIVNAKLFANQNKGKAKVKLKFDASNLPMQSLDEGGPVVGQLISSDADCIQSTFTMPHKKNDDTTFKAKK